MISNRADLLPPAFSGGGRYLPAAWCSKLVNSTDKAKKSVMPAASEFGGIIIAEQQQSLVTVW